MSINQPSEAALSNQYWTFLVNRKPCSRSSTGPNQCAVRMSVALMKSGCGFHFDDWPFRDMVVHQGGACRHLPPHVTGATPLSSYLEQQIGWKCSKYANSRRTGSQARATRRAIHNQPGIIYFAHCHSDSRGAHIDYWNGVNYFNEILNEAAGNGAGPGADLFARADSVWLFPVPRTQGGFSF